MARILLLFTNVYLCIYITATWNKGKKTNQWQVVSMT